MREEIISFLVTFAIGGGFCVLAQLLIDLTKLTPARILVVYVVSGVVLTALGWYQPIVNIAGCGATTPLTGFGYSLARGVEKAIDEMGPIGILTGGLTGTSGGITMAMSAGVLVAILFQGKRKS